MTTLNIRIDQDLKNKANKTFKDMGLDLSSAVKLFLHQSVKEKGLPFHPSNNPKAARMMWDREVAVALKNGKSYTSSKKMFDDIVKER